MLTKIFYGLAIVLTLAIAAFLVMFYNLARQSETIVNAGLQNNMLQDCPDRPSCVNSLSDLEQHAIAAFAVPDSMTEPVAAMAAVIMTMPRAEIIEVNDDYLHAIYSSAIFGFVDDLEILRDGEQLQVRSVSRVGFSDQGVNRRRVEELRRLWLQASIQN
tara:strand:+ start:123 stop:602 length:480 start_codon:yes stop_codon:yes gene_type:complete